MLERLKNDKVLLKAVERYLKAHYWKAASFYQIFQLGENGDMVRIKDGFEVYIITENIEIIGLIASCGGGLTLVHYADERVKSKYNVLMTLLHIEPTCLKGDNFSVSLTQKIIDKSISSVQEECYYWMSIPKDKILDLTESRLLEKIERFRPSGIEMTLANQIDFNEIVPFLIEVEKYFNRKSLSVNQLKKKMAERNLADAYLLVKTNNQAIGQGLLEYELPKHRLIGGIYVSERFRQKGIGNLITCSLIQLVLEKQKLPTLTVDVENKDAIKLYEQLGFEICADQKNCYIKLKGRAL
jgi:RimJ/RimL family protein N-acetyltransferase